MFASSNTGYSASVTDSTRDARYDSRRLNALRKPLTLILNVELRLNLLQYKNDNSKSLFCCGN